MTPYYKRPGLAAQRAGRRCVGVELSEGYCALAVRQLQQEVLL